MTEPGSRAPAAPVLPLALRRRRVSSWNPANLLTGLRMLLVLPFGLALFADGGHRTGWRLLATALFVLAAVTDKIDGHLARRYGWVTELGTFADPLADKALTGVAMIGLSMLGALPWWLTVLVLVREVAVTALRSVLARTASLPASRGGKLKTLLLSIGIGLLLLPLATDGVIHLVGLTVLLAAAVVSTVTGLDYALRGWALSRAARARRPARPGRSR